MKTLLATLLLAIAPTFVSAQNLVCKDIQMFDYDTNGKPIFVESGMAVDIKPSSSGKFGYIAEVTIEGKVEITEDVQLAMHLPADIDIEYFVNALRPDIAYDSIKNVRIGNVGVDANMHDANGIFIMELLAADDSVLGKIAQVGWAIGNCQ